ncbi:hypothetical protein [Phascolarctobacterium succinatutens]|uniref:hypothetical protein n=1 Tax=Phascolarctobacterium succinatutens TaxID=626940 RepID=UPI003AB18D65
MDTIKNSNKAGGAREGAGRKRELPEGARVTSFKLTDTERIAVKNFIAELRGGEKSKAKMLEAEREQQTDAIIEATVKPFAEELYKVINLYGGRGKGFREAERVGKTISIIAFKDAVQKWEKENPRD